MTDETATPGAWRPRTSGGRDALRALAADPSLAVVAADFDGTLAEIVDDPELARPVEGALEVLAALARAVDTVALVTGRAAATAVQYAGLESLAGTGGLVVLGHYGDERWDAASGTYTTTPPPPGLASARDALPALLRDLGAPAGVRLEDKGTSVAVHVRNAAEPRDLFARLAGPLRELADDAGLIVQPGRFVHELRGRTADKGTALRGLVAERGAGSVVYAGDDLGDLPAYAAVEALRAEGTPGLTIASTGPEPVPEVTDRADLVLAGPAEVVAFLRTLAPGRR